MLSKKDIYKELGKGLCICPFIEDNIKENSINVSSSEYAWTQEGGTAYWYGGNEFHIDSTHGKVLRSHVFPKGHKSVFVINHRDSVEKYLILFPHQTTLVETLEVIGIGNKIGGAVHSKVGIVIKGIGDCGTMLGPGYCGHLLFALHNITDDIIVLNIGETFGSLTFDYLKTPVVRNSTTIPSHLDKLLDMNLNLSTADKEYFSKDWKSNFAGVKKEMISQEKYKEFKTEHPENIFTQIKDFLCIRNIILIFIGLAIMFVLFLVAKELDQDLTEKVWMDRYFNVVVVAVFSVMLAFYGKLFKK